MDGLIFLSFVVAVVIGVAFVAFALKLLDSQEQRAVQEERKQAPEEVPSASAIATKVPAFFRSPQATRVPTAKQGLTERLPMLQEINERHIRWALEQARGDRAYAAGLLGTSEGHFALLVARHCGDFATAQHRVETARSDSVRRASSKRPRETVDDRLFAFIQNHIRAEQAVVSEFIHLPSIDALYRQARL